MENTLKPRRWLQNSIGFLRPKVEERTAPTRGVPKTFYDARGRHRNPQARIPAVCGGRLVNDNNRDYNRLRPAFLALAHLALASAASLALPAALNFRLGGCAALALAAIRLLTPARILARPRALSFRFRRARVTGWAGAPSS